MADGTIHNKEAFVNRISQKLGRERPEPVPLPKWQHRPQLEIWKDTSRDELTAFFKANSLEKTTAVIETNNSSLNDALQDVIGKYGSRVVTTKDPRFADFGLDLLLAREETYTWDVERGQENIEIAKQADIGIFFSEFSLAESGTVVQFNDKDIARSVSLLPTAYVAIVPKSTIVPRMTQATQAIHKVVEQGDKLPTCINFISGPSNSADIEMNIVIGVHGPVEAVHIIVTDR